jgi:ATP-dependent RNA helicase DeaD
MVRYRIDVGRDHGVQVKDIVGAIANEAGIESRFIGRIGLYDESSTVELPAGMPAEAANALKRTRVRGVPINLRPDEGRSPHWKVAAHAIAPGSPNSNPGRSSLNSDAA